MRRRLLYAADTYTEFTVTSESGGIHPYVAFASNVDLFPDAPLDGETLFIEMACTKEDYSEYAMINESPTSYLLGYYNENNELDRATKFTVCSYGTSQNTASQAQWNIINGKVYPTGVRKGFIEGLTYNVRYWYVPFIVGSYNLLGGN